MREELDSKLQERFSWLKRPELKRERYFDFVPGYTNYQNYGFCEVSDGWFSLISNLCEEIEEIYKRENQTIDIGIYQVKSKFGRLRWYYGRSSNGKEHVIHAIDSMLGGGIRLCPEGERDSIDKALAEVIKKYEELSKSTCEHCGATENVELRTERPYFGWVETLCSDCMNTKIELYKNHMEERKQEKREDYTD